MWMMGYSDGGGEINTIQDPFTGRKLRPLMPRPTAAAAPPCLTRIHSTDLFALNHHIAMSEQSKRDLNNLTSATAQQVVVSSRWNPTPEQLQTLEELYRRGTRTPTAEQIQHITSQLRRYGKIEGKNVFYWFQNHKARERQKRRRQLETTFSDEKREEPSGANRTLFEVEQTKNWASPTNSSTAAEKSGEAEAECKADDGWLQFEDDNAAQRRRNATWRIMNLSCSSSSSSSLPSSTLVPTTAAAAAANAMQFKPQDFLNIFFQPANNNTSSSPNPHHSSSSAAEAEAHTLELFPLRSGRGGNDECSDNEEGDELGVGMSSSGCDVAPCQFFEFLPLKN